MTQPTISPEIKAEAQRQLEILSQGTVDILPEGALLKKLEHSLATKTPLKIKLGADPTRPDIHVGHAVVLMKLRQFQDLGHTVQMLIGDYTSRIGDPSGKSKTRPPLSGVEIDENAKTYAEQVYKVLDPAKTEIMYNSTWLSKLSFEDTIRLCSQVTVAQLMERDDFTKRFEANQPIAMHEMLYPIMQGYDSVAMACDVEIGGTDQTFNCLMGRTLQKAAGQPEQVVLTMPLLEGLDGVQKMSKSLDNYIGLTDAPNDMYGKVMSIPDEIMGRYFNLLTDIPTNQRPEHPMDAKKLLAATLVERYHSSADAEAAAQDFATRFSKREIPEDLPEETVATEGGEIGLLTLLNALGFTQSNGEARRLVQQNAIKMDGETLTDANMVLKADITPFILQAGKRRMARVSLK